MWRDHLFSQRIMATERAVVVGVEADRDGGREGAGGHGQNLKKGRGGRQYREGGLHKIRELASLFQQSKET